MVASFWNWFENKVLPGIIVGHLMLTTTYVRLHFEKRWPYWGRQRPKDDE